MLRVVLFLCSLPLVFGCGYLSGIAWLGVDDGSPSRCFGSNADGSLWRPRRLAYSGENFRAYSFTGYAGGRTFVHSAVRDTMRDAYGDLARSHPELRFVYAESSWPRGGQALPQASYRNGTAMDFIVPVRTRDGRVAELPTTHANHYGYGIELDDAGRHMDLELDLEAMALHLLALDKAARRHEIAIRRVVFDVGLQRRLLAAAHGPALRERIAFDEHDASARPDQLYHVDFAVACEPLPRAGPS